MMKKDKVQQKDGYIVVNDLFNGTIFLKQSNNYLIGVVNTNDEKTAVDYINRVVSGIK